MLTDGYDEQDIVYVWTHGSARSIKMAADMTLSQFDLIGCPAGNATITKFGGQWEVIAGVVTPCTRTLCIMALRWNKSDLLSPMHFLWAIIGHLYTPLTSVQSCEEFGFRILHIIYFIIILT